MLADLDLLCIAIFCAADDFLPKPAKNARRKLFDAEVVTLCVAQVLLGIPSERRFLAAAATASRTCSRCCRPRTPSTSAAPGWRTASSG
jgi:hypothetical protein